MRPLLAVLPMLASLGVACTDPLRVSPADRRAIADSLSALVTNANDYSAPEAPAVVPLPG